MVTNVAAKAFHWNYFLSIEQDLERLSRYIEFDEQNYTCFSIEIAHLLMAAAAEVDVVCKQICQAINPISDAHSIQKYRNEIVPSHPGMPQFEVLAPRYGLQFAPWSDWIQSNGVPAWWTAYNKTKHHRHTHYAQANLQNALNAVAGLFVACLYLYKDKALSGELIPLPTILRPIEERWDSTEFADLEFRIVYDLEKH